MAQEVATDEPVIPGEIVVEGELSQSALRRELLRAEQAVNRLFNDLNDDDRFDIVCRGNRETGTFISERICEPAFLGKLRYDSYQDYVVNNTAELEDQQLLVVYRELFEEFQSRLEEAARTSPAFFEAVRRHSQLKRAYEAGSNR